MNVAEAEQKKVAEDIYQALGKDVLLDDREERVGVKLKDMDLIGIPIKIIVGPKGLKDGKVELKMRKSGEVEMVEIGKIVETNWCLLWAVRMASQRM